MTRPALRGMPAMLALSTAILVTACGGGGDTSVSPTGSPPVAHQEVLLPDAASLGACPDEFKDNEANSTLDAVPADDRLKSNPGWQWWSARLIRPSTPVVTQATTPQDRSIAVELVDAAKPGVVGPAASAVPARVHGWSIPYLEAATANGYSMLVYARPSGLIEVVAAAGTDGRIAFVGPCEYTTTSTPFALLFKSSGESVQAPTPAALLTKLAAGDPAARDLVADWGKPTTKTWAELPADQRSIDVERMPADVVSSLRRLRVEFSMPPEWKSRSDLTFCTRTSLAWGECAALAADGLMQPVSVTAYVRDGEDLELWLLDGDGHFDPPVARLHTVPWAEVSSLLSAGTTASFRPVASIARIEDLIARAKSGERVVERL